MSGTNSIANHIEKINAEIEISHNTPPDFLLCCKNDNDSESVWLREPVTNKKAKLALNHQLMGKSDGKYHRFSIKNNIVSKINIPEEAEIKKLKSDALNTYIIFRFWNDNVFKFIKDIVVYYVENFEPSDKFGCCGKYKECSEAGKCLHDNKFYAKACWYRKNLESGNAFLI